MSEQDYEDFVNDRANGWHDEKAEIEALIERTKAERGGSDAEARVKGRGPYPSAQYSDENVKR